MKELNEMIKELSFLSNRHNSFKNIFNKFQRDIDHLQSDTFPIKYISLNHVSDDKTIISFIGRTYELNFSSCMVDGVFNGKISASRVIDDDNANEIASITYNGESVVDVEAPQGEDPITLVSDVCCFNLVLNWLSSEINT